MNLVLFLFTVAYSIWTRRPRSELPLRVSYQDGEPKVLNATPRNENGVTEVEVDYVVVGGGPGGLSAARALLTATVDSRVWVIEAGRDDLSTSSLGAFFQYHTPSRVPVLNHRFIELPRPSRPLGILGSREIGKDWSFVARRPLRPTVPAEDTLNSYAAFPQGRHVDGTGCLSWGLSFPSAYQFLDQGETADSKIGSRSRIPSRRVVAHPVGWAFEEVLTRSGIPCASVCSDALLSSSSEKNSSELETKEESVWRENETVVHEPAQHVNADSCRLPVSTMLFQDVSSSLLERLWVLPEYEVVHLEWEATSIKNKKRKNCASRKVVSLMVRRSGKVGCNPGRLIRIKVKQGVVLAAGLVGSPRLAAQVCFPPPLDAPVVCRDALVLPLLFKAKPGVSLDNLLRSVDKPKPLFFLQSLFSPTFSSVLRREITELTHCICRIPLNSNKSHTDPGELLIFLTPFGGRDHALYYRFGLDRILGSYQEAVTFYIVLTGLEDLTHHLQNPLVSPQKSIDDAAERRHADLLSRGLFPLAAPEGLLVANHQLNSNTALVESIENGFKKGIQLCRQWAKEEPLLPLLEGKGEQEALDFTLLKEDPVKAKRLTILLRTPLAKLTVSQKKEVVELVDWGHTLSKRDEYLKDYISHHARWLGFGSGTSTSFLTESTSPNSDDLAEHFSVRGCSNVVVGDCSAISDHAFKVGAHGNALLAANIETAVDCGRMAASELVSSCSS